jgi:hypothetical protein
VRLWIGTFALLFLVTFTPRDGGRGATGDPAAALRARPGPRASGGNPPRRPTGGGPASLAGLGGRGAADAAGRTRSRYDLSDVQSLDICSGRRQTPNKGVAILLGAVIGAVLGGAVGYVMTRDNPEDPGIGMFIGLPVGALVGGLVGFVATTGDSPQRWDSIALQR